MLTVELRSRLASYVMNKATIEEFIEDNKLDAEEEADARQYWVKIERDLNDTPKGMQPQLPNEWS